MTGDWPQTPSNQERPDGHMKEQRPFSLFQGRRRVAR